MDMGKAYFDNSLYQNKPFNLVEARGVEPLSENISTAFSPGADDPLHSFLQVPVVRLRELVASYYTAGAKLSRRAFTT